MQPIQIMLSPGWGSKPRITRRVQLTTMWHRRSGSISSNTTTKIFLLQKMRTASIWKYHSIAAAISRDPLTVSRIRNRWVQDGNNGRLAGPQWPPITRSQKIGMLPSWP
ncbi:hypothetical protein TNCV_898721 [Trichonephila clavipes]|nr:hypothetical protein TNCV_898721 [Trichonephila clavipes]